MAVAALIGEVWVLSRRDPRATRDRPQDSADLIPSPPALSLAGRGESAARRSQAVFMGNRPTNHFLFSQAALSDNLGGGAGCLSEHDIGAVWWRNGSGAN